METVAERGGTLRRQCHRGVAAATAVDAALLRSGLVSGRARDGGLLPQRANPIVRYASLEALLQEHARPDPHKATREALLALQTVPVLRDEFAALDDTSLRTICLFLGERSKTVAHVGSVCRRLRNIVISLTPSVAVIVPEMIPLEKLASDTVVDSICAFFATYKRGQFVQQLRLVDAKYASSLTVSATLPICSPHVFPSLVKLMPNLTFLDLRGVRWDCHSNPNLLQYFLSDLHLVAPRLQTLKIGVELFTQWSPGWWQRFASLVQLVVGSRRDQATTPATAPHTVTLHEDVFEMLRTPHRPWRVKLWCGLETASVARLLMPTQPLLELEELALNLSNKDVLEDFKRPSSKPTRESKSQKGAKKANAHNHDEAETRALFPSLQALTLANVDQSATLATDLLAWMTFRAPRLKYFSIVNTTRVPPPPRARRLV